MSPLSISEGIDEARATPALRRYCEMPSAPTEARLNRRKSLLLAPALRPPFRFPAQTPRTDLMILSLSGLFIHPSSRIDTSRRFVQPAHGPDLNAISVWVVSRMPLGTAKRTVCVTSRIHFSAGVVSAKRSVGGEAGAGLFKCMQSLANAWWDSTRCCAPVTRKFYIRSCMGRAESPPMHIFQRTPVRSIRSGLSPGTSGSAGSARRRSRPHPR